jgi:hypothetical protein
MLAWFVVAGIAALWAFAVTERLPTSKRDALQFGKVFLAVFLGLLALGAALQILDR